MCHWSSSTIHCLSAFCYQYNHTLPHSITTSLVHFHSNYFFFGSVSWYTHQIMPICNLCQKPVLRLAAHLNFCSSFRNGRKPSKRKRVDDMFHNSFQNRSREIRQCLDTTNVAKSLSGDTHKATPSVVSDQLHCAPSIRQNPWSSKYWWLQIFYIWTHYIFIWL